MVKYPALKEKSNLLKKAIQWLIYPINLLIGWMGFSPFFPNLNQLVKEDEKNREKRAKRAEAIRKNDLLALRKVHSFVKELRTPRIVNILDKLLSSQEAFLKKGHPHVVAKWMKEDFLIVKNYFLIGKITPVDQRSVWRKTSRTVPVPGYLIPVLTEKWTPSEKALFISYFRSYRVILIEGPHKLSTVYESLGFSAFFNVVKLRYLFLSNDSIWVSLGIPKIAVSNKLKQTINPEALWSPGSLNLRTWQASGPNGPDLLGRLADVYAFSNKPFLIMASEVISKFNLLVLGSSGCKDVIFSPRGLLNWIGWTKVWNLKDNLKGGHLHNLINFGKVRRLVCFGDGIGKWRYIAIRDWLTQLTLKPLHAVLMEYLKALPQDATYDQRKVRQWALEIYMLGKPVYSLDLSAATDRIPILIQAQILRALFPQCGPRVWVSWYWIIVGEFFYSKQFGVLRYQTGQGIGTYSSWAVMAVSHHVLVRMRAISCGISNFQDYLILGDDIVIANKQVAESYIKTIESIGISISIPKSVIRNDTHFGVEFASRYIIAEGVDISPLSIGHLFEPTVERLFALWDELLERGYEFNAWPNYWHAYDFKSHFPLADKAIGHEELSTVWAYGKVFSFWDTLPLHIVQSGFLEAPLGSPLQTEEIRLIWESLPISKYILYLKELKNRKISLFNKSLNSAELVIFDRTVFKNKVLKNIPKRQFEAINYLDTWDELWILFQSPFLSVQTRLEIKMEEILASKCDNSLPIPYGGIQFHRKYWEGLTLLPDSLEDLEELTLLSMGPLALFLRSTFELSSKKGIKRLRSTRLSGAKIKMLWESSLKVNSIKGLLKNNVLSSFKPSLTIPGNKFIICKYIKPRPRIFTLNK